MDSTYRDRGLEGLNETSTSESFQASESTNSIYFYDDTFESVDIPENKVAEAQNYSHKDIHDDFDIEEFNHDQTHHQETKEMDAHDHLFASYAKVFKSFSRKNQVMLKYELAKLFAEVEMKELNETSRTTIVKSPAKSEDGFTISAE